MIDLLINIFFWILFYFDLIFFNLDFEMNDLDICFYVLIQLN